MTGPIMQQEDKSAYDTLREHFSDITSSSLDPGKLADGLYQAKLIDAVALEKGGQTFIGRADRLRDLLSRVLHNGKPGAFPDVVLAIKKDPADEWLAKKLIDTYTRKGGKWSPVQATSSDPADTRALHGVGVIQINSSDIEFGDELGHSVHKGKWISQGIDISIKRVGKTIIETKAQMLSHLEHPNVIQLLGVINQKPDFYLIIEFAEGGCLYDLIHVKHSQYDRKQGLKWAKEIAEGMEYLHQQEIVHLSLKSPNVLLTTDKTVKLCDFALKCGYSSTSSVTLQDKRWIAPEVFKEKLMSKSSDVFSYGIVLLEILTQTLPFAKDSEIRLIIKGERPTIPSSCEPFKDLLDRCLKINPEDRPRFSEILSVLFQVNQINISDIEFEDDLGDGQGSVYKGKWISHNTVVAVKRIKIKIIKTKVQILSRLKHINIIQLLGVINSTPDSYLVIDFAEGGSLYDLIHVKHSQYDHEKGLKWAKEIAEGMEYLHEQEVIHMSLKSPNVLLTADKTVKLCDFALKCDYTSSTSRVMFEELRWIAPEVLEKNEISTFSDVFSYGVVLMEILTHDLPHAEFPDILKGERPPIPSSCEPFTDLLVRCWKINPEDRPPFSEILSVLCQDSYSPTILIEPNCGFPSGIAQAADQLLGEEDHFEIADYLHNLMPNHSIVYILGIVLGLYPSTVTKFKKIDTFLDDVITAWLRREDCVKELMVPTWRSLVEALRNSKIRQYGLAIADDISRDKGL